MPVAASPPKEEFNHTVAPDTGAKFCETKASNLTVRPNKARSGAVSAMEKTPVFGGGVVDPGLWILTKDQKLYSCGGVLTHPTQRSLRYAFRFLR